ncbi:MAG: S41 family peptidase [Hespellia sp.]|nr:S41 family peptidase [Hespellia sp.]
MENQNEELNQESQIESQADQPKKDRKFLKGALTGALIMFLLVAVIGTVGYFKVFRGETGSDKNVLTSAADVKLNLLKNIIDKYYLYDVTDEQLQDGIYAGVIGGLDDPYSVYYDEEATKALLESTSGEYSGVGAVLSQDETTGYIVVMNVYEDSPAKKAGLTEGDIIYQVDDRQIEKEDLTEIVSWIKGDEGTDVVLHVYRGENLDQVDITVTRAKIEAQTVEHEMKDNNIGYIRVSEFDAVTKDQFEAALTDLENQGMSGLVIDLRSNPGGDVDVTCDMLRLLLPEGKIVYTKDKDGKEKDYDCDGTHEFKKPLTVLVNGNSASAAEIFTGAVQDYGIGTIVGTTTYGKGVVQSVIDLQDGTYMKITTAEYFTPEGRNINKKGIDPDVEVEYQANEENPAADNQLDKAVEIITGEIQQEAQ